MFLMMTTAEAKDLAENPAVFSAIPSEYGMVDLLITDGRPVLELGVTADQAEYFAKCIMAAVRTTRSLEKKRIAIEGN